MVELALLALKIFSVIQAVRLIMVLWGIVVFFSTMPKEFKWEWKVDFAVAIEATLSVLAIWSWFL